MRCKIGKIFIEKSLEVTLIKMFLPEALKINSFFNGRHSTYQNACYCKCIDGLFWPLTG